MRSSRYVVDAPFSDIGTPADYLQTSLELAAAEGDRLVAQSREFRVDPTARWRARAVWDDVTIGATCTLDECIVCDGVHVPAGSSYRRTALVPYARTADRQDERVEGGLLLRRFERRDRAARDGQAADSSRFYTVST